MDQSKDLDIKNEENTDENMQMADLLGPEIAVEEGKILKVRVISQNEDGVFVDLGLKSEGVIPCSEFDESFPMSSLKPGDEISVMVVKMRTPSGYPQVSWRRIREQEGWNRIVEMQKAGTPVEGTIRRKIKGGMIVDVGGVDAFLPASQVELRFVGDLEPYVGKTLPFLITEINRSQKNVVVSRRKLLEIDQQKKRDEVLGRLSEGDIIEGPVTGITDFGAFIDLGGVEGLLHIGDIVWYHLKKVDEVLKKGQQVKVQVLKIDREKGKISLGMKQISARPWETAAERYPEGVIVTGKVTSVTDFGVFVAVEPGIEGLLHMSEISWDESRKDLKKLFRVGQEIQAKVIAVDPDKEKMSLSIKRTQANPWDEVQARYAPGTKVKGVVTNLTPFGAFVRLPEGIEGLIHIADFSWTRKVNHPQDMLQTGQEVEVVVLEVNPRNEKIALSLKHVSEDPFKKYRSGAAVSGVVKRVTDFGAFVELEPGVEALLRASEMGPARGELPAEPVKEGQTVEAKVIKSDSRERKIDISIRKLEHDRERELVRKYANRDDRPTLGEVLEHHEGTEDEDTEGK